MCTFAGTKGGLKKILLLWLASENKRTPRYRDAHFEMKGVVVLVVGCAIIPVAIVVCSRCLSGARAS